MALAFQCLGQGPPLVILHGLYGQGRNWRQIARELATDYTVYLPDLPNHGQSPWTSEWTLASMSEALGIFIRTHQLAAPIIVGHSLGGKVAMHYAARYYPTRLSHLVVVDIAPRAYDPSYHLALTQTLLDFDLSQISNRTDADQALAKAIPDRRIRQFLLTNLKRESKGFSWQLNLEVIHQNLSQVMDAVAASFYNDFYFDEKPVLFIRGEKSDYIQPADQALIQEKFPGAQSVSLPAGHWIHAEIPETFIRTLKRFLEAN